MSNQYKSALQHAADDFTDELFRHNVVVLPHAILHRDKVVDVFPGIAKAECRRVLKQFLETLEQTSLLDNQEKLL